MAQRYFYKAARSAGDLDAEGAYPVVQISTRRSAISHFILGSNVVDRVIVMARVGGNDKVTTRPAHRFPLSKPRSSFTSQPHVYSISVPPVSKSGYLYEALQRHRARMQTRRWHVMDTLVKVAELHARNLLRTRRQDPSPFKVATRARLCCGRPAIALT